MSASIEENEPPTSPTTGLPVPPNLDHLVHLVPPGKLDEAIKQFERLGFAVEHGGVHADGLTHNALIVLTDGVYIEIISFLDGPAKGRSKNETETKDEWHKRRQAHWWWGKQVGWTDWCLEGGVKDGRVASINERAKSAEAVADGVVDSTPQREGESTAYKQQLWATAAAYGAPTDHHRQEMEARQRAQPSLVRYDEPREGGRMALSGRKIRWKVTFPAGRREERGMVPFWCEDVTPRFWRVPLPSPHHPNKTQGLTSLTLLYHPETFSSRLSSLRLVLNNIAPPSSTAEEGGSLLTVPPPLVDGNKPAIPPEPVTLLIGTPEGPPLPVRVKAAEDPEELSWLAKYGEGLFEVEISGAHHV